MMEHIESRMLQTTITTRNVRYDRSYTASIKYVKKPDRMLGFFIGKILIKSFGYYIGFRLLSRPMTITVGA